MTRLNPTGAKHDRCVSHVEHPYPAKGVLCIGPTIGAAGMVAFADHLAETAAGHRAADLAMIEARHLAPKMTRGSGKAQPTIRNAPKGAGHIGRTAADAAALAELVARYRAMRGLPAPVNVEPAAETRPASKGETRVPVGKYVGVRHIGHDWRAFDLETGSDIGGPHRTRRDAVAYALEREATTYGPAPHCASFLHTLGVAPIRCTVEPDMHDGPHDYGRTVEPIAEPDTYAAAVEFAETRPDPCAECGHPAHGATCAECDDAAQVGTYSPCAVPAAVPAPVEPIAEAAPVLSAPAPVNGRPTCERCGQVFRKSGAGAEWHRVNRPDCARVAVAV